MILLRDSGKLKIVSPGNASQHSPISHQSNLFTAKAAKGRKGERRFSVFPFAVFASVAVGLTEYLCVPDFVKFSGALP
jgi:hypothetical protein